MCDTHSLPPGEAHSRTGSLLGMAVGGAPDHPLEEVLQAYIALLETFRPSICLMLPFLFSGGKSMSGTPPLFVGGLVGTDNPTGELRSIQPPRTRVALTKSAPDAVCCVPLLSRRVLVHLQNLVDELNHRPQSRLGSYRNLRSGGTALTSPLPNYPPKHCQLLCHIPNRPTPKRCSRRSLFK